MRVVVTTGVKMKHYSKREKEKQLTQSLTHFPLLFLLAFFSRLFCIPCLPTLTFFFPIPLPPSAPILPFLLLPWACSHTEEGNGFLAS